MAIFEQQPVLLLLCFTLLFTTSQSTQSRAGHDVYVIRSAAPNGLVLDASDPKQVTLQHFTGFKPQLWRLEPTVQSGNLVYIVNDYTGQSLDFAEHDKLFDLVTSEHKSLLRQQWNLTVKRRIVNVECGKNVDVYKANYTAGARVGLWEDNGDKAQEFIIQKKT